MKTPTRRTPPELTPFKNDKIEIRLSKAHKAILVQKAQRVGLSVSSWLLTLGLQATAAPPVS